MKGVREAEYEGPKAKIYNIMGGLTKWFRDNNYPTKFNLSNGKTHIIEYVKEIAA